jgi:DNA-binding CsgD family transcriptional regulator/tetratricopeptide (TPR) repeat protein
MPLVDPMVGREQELSLLGRRLADARSGSGHLILVCGPAGIGKTRLVEELADESEQVGWGAAVADAGMPALWPWVRAVRGMPAPRQAVASLAAGSHQRESSSAEEAAAVTFAADAAVLEALDEHATGAPGMLVVLDDLQWADGATLRLLDRVAAEIRRIPMVVVGIHRDVADLPAHRATEVLSLGPLSLSEAAGVLTAVVPDANVAAVRRAAEMSGGSPLYLKTLAKVAGQALRGKAELDASAGAAPELRHLVAAALRLIGPDTVAAVEALSVLGPDPEAEVMWRLIGADSPSAALERLRPAGPAGLVEFDDADQVRFAHGLVRDATYASLSPSRRIALHRAAAEALEPLAVGRDERAGAVAHHWHRAGEPELAAGWAARAAEAARSAGAYDDATAYLQMALDAGPPDRAEPLLDLARTLYLAGRIPDSVDTCGLAADEGERTGRPDVAGRAAIIVQGIGDPDINHRLEDLSRRALLRLGDTGPMELRARVEAQLACTLLELGHDEEAAERSSSALALAVVSGEPNAELDAIRARAALQWRPQQDLELIELGGRAIELADPAGRPLARLWAHLWRSDGAIHQADPAAAQREIGEIRRLADRTGLPLVRWHMLRREATMAALVGDFVVCRQRAAEAAEFAAGWDDISIQFTHFGQSVCLALLRGDSSELTPGWTEYLGAVPFMPLVAQATVAGALLVDDRRDEASDLYHPLIQRLPEMQRGVNASALIMLVGLAPALGDEAGCHALRTHIAELYGATPAMGEGTVFYQGSVARILGDLDLGCGDPAAAVAHYEEGLRVDGVLMARPHLAHGGLGLARALGDTGELTRAAELARTAAAEARRLDLPGLLRAADAFLGEVAAEVRAEDPLTPREREVADLVVQALSNKAIADHLVLSERTVESHVRSILAKTGLTTRTELTRLYLQQRRSQQTRSASE